MKRGVRLLGVAVLLTLTLVGLTPGPSYAHTKLTSSLPAKDAVIGTMPPRVLLVFSDPLDPSRIQMDVVGPDKASVIAGPVSVRGNTAQQPVTAGPNGKYVISYEVISADTHVVTGSLTFTLQPGAPPAPSEPAVIVVPSGSSSAGAGDGVRTTGVAPAAGGNGTTGGGIRWWLWLIPVLAGGAAAGSYVMVARMRRADTPPEPAQAPEAAHDGDGPDEAAHGTEGDGEQPTGPGAAEG